MLGSEITLPTTQTILLAVVQGVTEFLPISSSGHLILTSWLFSWEDPGLTFDLAVHTGTLIALVTFFARDWFHIITGAIAGRSIAVGNTVISGRKILLLILASNIPLGLMFLMLGDRLDDLFRSPVMVGYSLIATSLTILASEKIGATRKSLNEITPMVALWVMIAQSFAVIPGISRSGMSMSGAVAYGVNRETAARYSFLLAGPAMSGASLLAILRVTESSASNDISQLLFGAVIALTTAMASIKLLLSYLRTHSLALFGYYCFVVGLTAVVFA